MGRSLSITALVLSLALSPYRASAERSTEGSQEKFLECIASRTTALLLPDSPKLKVLFRGQGRWEVAEAVAVRKLPQGGAIYYFRPEKHVVLEGRREFGEGLLTLCRFIENY